MIKIRT